ncbi:hypothetical protein ACO0QE_000713 [Hanseniaspora vineae]
MAGYYAAPTEKGLEKPRYFVELTAQRFADFELMNSLYSLKNFDSLLYLLENPIDSQNSTDQFSTKFVVPSFNILCVLYTLATLPFQNEDKRLEKLHQHSVSTESLQTRSIQLLNEYVLILQDFDTELYDEKDLLSLRCQFFILIDYLFNIDTQASHSQNALTQEQKLDKFIEKYTHQSDAIRTMSLPPNCRRQDVKKQLAHLQYLNSFYYPRLVSPFHVNDSSSLKIADRLLFPLQFTTQKFWTTVEYIVASSKVQSDKPIQYLSSYWTPVLNSIFHVLIMREHFFVTYELRGDVFLKDEKFHNLFEYDSKDLLEQLRTGPVATAFQSLKKFHGWNSKFREVLFPDNPLQTVLMTEPFYLSEVAINQTVAKRVLEQGRRSSARKMKSSSLPVLVSDSSNLSEKAQDTFAFFDNLEENYILLVKNILTCFISFEKHVAYYLAKIDSMKKYRSILKDSFVFSDDFFEQFAMFLIKECLMESSEFQTYFSVDEIWENIESYEQNEFNLEYLNVVWFFSIATLFYISFDELDQRIYHIEELPKVQTEMYSFIVDLMEDAQHEQGNSKDLTVTCLHNLMTIFKIIEKVYPDLLDQTLYNKFLDEMSVFKIDV